MDQRKCSEKRESGTEKKKRLWNMRENVIDQRKSWTEKTLRKEYDWKEIQKRKKRKADNSYKRKKEKQVKLKINQALEKEEK